VKNQVALTITSLLSILFSMFHLADDIVYGMSPGRLSNLPFFFVWTLLALGVTAVFSVILSARGLWSLRRGQQR
jgi:uncharacterized membrane protein YGL010W